MNVQGHATQGARGRQFGRETVGLRRAVREEALLAGDSFGTDGGEVGKFAHGREKRIAVHRGIAAEILFHGAAEEAQGGSGAASMGEVIGGPIFGL